MLHSIKKFLAGFALLSVELIVMLILFVLALFAFIYFTKGIFTLEDTSFDSQVFLSLRPYISETNTKVMRFITFFATHTFLLPANILLSLIFLLKKHRWYTLKVPVVALGSYLVMSSLKLFFTRPRPLDPVYEAARGFSFPSGHAMSAVTFYGLLIYLVWKNINQPFVKWILTILLVAFIFLIGFSRVYLRVHYASDVIAGFSMGLIWLVISLWVMSIIEKYTRKKIAPAVNQPSVQS